ncbi:MAG TPA: collagen-like protein [Solirubrobacteraceae bacterium]|nr:collagen-like protein [Solirubrobacteraceae bacterium]
MSKLRSKLTYANVMVTIALFLALGGTGYAAATLPKNSVGTTQLRSGAVTSSKVKDGSLQATDFKANQLPRGPQGASGPQGERGPAGEPGPRGPAAGTAIAPLDLPNNGSGTVADVPGVGRLDALGCGDLNVDMHFVNTSGASQSWVLTSSFQARLSWPADAGTLAPGGVLDNGHNDKWDIVRLSVVGPRSATFEVSVTRTAANHCLFWGHVLSA